MNLTDTVCTGERAELAWDHATDQAEREVYEALRDLFGVQGENLAFYLDRATFPTIRESIELLHGLRDAYRGRIKTRANRIVESMTGD